MTLTAYKVDPRLDLVLEKIVDAPRELVWKAWTTPEYLKQWFTPAPWTTEDCEIKLYPGGVFRTVIRSPEGKEYEQAACYLEVIENEKLVWTDALTADYRPGQPNECFNRFFTAVVMFEPHERGTKYTVIARHGDEESRQRHEERGFQDGWGKALEQLVALTKTM